MAFHLDQIPANHKKEEDIYTIITEGDGIGSVYITSENRKIVSGLPVSEEVPVEKLEDFSMLLPSEEESYFLTPCVEGTVVKVWFSRDGDGNYIPMFSGTKRVFYEESFWGFKDKKFGKLFRENGGDSFLESLSDDEKAEGISYYFIIMDRSLVITSRINMLDNETIVFFIGIVDIEGNISMPAEFDNNVFYQHNDRSSVLPTSELRAGRILVPTVLSPEEAFSVITNGYDSHNYPEKDIPYSYHRGESVILRHGNHIKKITPPCYETRKIICGDNANIKYVLYCLMDIAKNEEKYRDSFKPLGCLTKQQLLEIKGLSDKTEATTRVLHYLSQHKDISYDASSINDRRDIITHCVLFCPLHKIDSYIDSYMDYLSCRFFIQKFMQKHSSQIRKGAYDERLSEHHQKALARLKDMTERAKIYASEKDTRFSYPQKMEYKMRFFLQNEMSWSLYKIEKAVRFIQT
jgi:hypothetical protein